MKISRKPHLWGQWHAAAWYVRVAIAAAAVAILCIAALELALDGSALWGNTQNGHYYVGHKPGLSVHEVSFAAWVASWAAHYFGAASWLGIAVAVIVQWWRRRAHT